MGRVDLHDVEPGGQRPQRGGDEGVADLGELVDRQRVRRRPAGPVGERRWPTPSSTAPRPAGRSRASPGCCRPTAAGCWPWRRRGRAGSRRRTRARAGSRRHPRQPGHVLVGPQADVAVADPSLGGHAGRLDDHQAEAAEREPSQMGEVVVADEPSVTEYWHIGATARRLGSVRPRRVRGAKRAGVLTNGGQRGWSPGSSVLRTRRPRRNISHGYRRVNGRYPYPIGIADQRGSRVEQAPLPVDSAPATHRMETP